MHQRNLRFLFEDYRSFYFHSLVKSTFLVSKGLLCLFDKQNNIWARADIKVLFSCSTRHLTCSLRLLVSYRIKHSKRNSISARAHVLSSISLWIHCHGSLYFDQWEKHFNFLSGKGHFQRYLKRRCRTHTPCSLTANWKWIFFLWSPLDTLSMTTAPPFVPPGNHVIPRR